MENGKPFVEQVKDNKRTRLLNMKSKPKASGWIEQAFQAKQVKKGNVIRRDKRSVHKIVGFDELRADVKRRGYHLLSVGTQYVILCNSGKIEVLC